MSNKDLTGWVCIARTGTFPDSSGKPHTFTEADLENIRANYDPKQSEAALVFGHPETSAPAYGWVHDLKKDKGKLFARFAQVPDKVRDLVAQGSYRYVSMSLSQDRQRLLHVGLLGAVAPAIDGLGPVEFGASNVTIDFAAFEARDDGGKMDPDLQKQIAALMEQIEALKAKNEALEAKLAETENGKAEAEKKADDTAAEFSAFKTELINTARKERVRALVDSGRLEPAKELETLSFASALADLKQPVNFSTADGKSEEISAEERFFRELEARQQDPRFVNFSAHAALPAHVANPGPAYSAEDVVKGL